MKSTLYASLALALSATRVVAACGQTEDEVNARCYPTLQRAVDAALALDKPLLLPRGAYPVTQTVVIDYTAHAGRGFELISHGAIIDGTRVHNGPVLQIVCAKDCFYFHQEGTLFIDADTPGHAFQFGKADFSDAHNSVKLDHLVVNNRNTGWPAGACQFNYVLNADVFAVCDSAGGIGMDIRQLQFSTLKGAASAGRGYAMAIEDGYVIANVFQAIDQEASPVCTLLTSPHANGNTWTGYYQNCPLTDVLSHLALTGNTVTGGVIGGETKTQWQWLD